MNRYHDELVSARSAALAAGAVIRRHYEAGSVDVTAKPDDSPVTRADLEANEVILRELAEAFPGDAILSEESDDDPSRLTESRVWIVDPLDGTRDFVARSGDFAVHIGLAVDGEPVLGVVYKPVGDLLYAAVRGAGATVQNGDETTRLRVSTEAALAASRIGVTRLAKTDNLGKFLTDTGLAHNAVTIGASIKMMAVASGNAEISLCLHGREKEWDTCAPEVIVREAGGRVTDVDGNEFVYNKRDVRHSRGIAMSNGLVHDALLEAAHPYFAA